MTGPEHYREAERLRDQAWDRDVTESGRTALLADAQVHATLALAAAAALDAIGGAHYERTAREWHNAIIPDRHGVTR